MIIKQADTRSRYYVISLLLLCFLALIGCKDTTSVSYDKTRINDILYNIKSAFIDHDIDALMLYFHPDYLHKGQTKWQIREVWLTRMAEYQLIDFQNIVIQVQDDNAMVSFTMKLQNAQENVYSDEPETHGDLSYFHYDDSDWYVYGNQLNY